MIVLGIIIYILIGVILTKPWNNDGGLFLIHIPWWVMAILCLLWLPITLIKFPFALKEHGVRAITEPLKKVILHIWLPMIIYYQIKDRITEGHMRQFQKSLVFRRRWKLDLFKKVQSVKGEIGYIYWATGEETRLSDGSIRIECQMCQRLC